MEQVTIQKQQGPGGALARGGACRGGERTRFLLFFCKKRPPTSALAF